MAGADAVAELDVNHSYPKFLFYERDAESGKLLAKRAIIDALEYQPNRYVELPSRRDFFYLARQEPQASR